MTTPLTYILFLLDSEDDYSIDIYSFGICALEVSDYPVVIKSALPKCKSNANRIMVLLRVLVSFCRWPSWRFKPMGTMLCLKKP